MSLYDDAQNGTLTKSKLQVYCRSTNINATDHLSGFTPLIAATIKGHTSVVELLLINGADPMGHSRYSCVPLWYAVNAAKNRKTIVELLIKHGAVIDTQHRANANDTPLMHAIRGRQDYEVIAMLVDAGSSVTLTNDRGETAKSLADRTQNPNIMRAILPGAERGGSHAELINFIVSLVLFIIAFVNNAVVMGTVKGVVKSLYNITGAEDAQLTTNLGEPRTVDDFKEAINNHVQKTGIGRFFAPDNPYLEKVAEKAVELANDSNNSLNTPDQIRDLTTLALYQPVLYCDDSGSMANTTDGRWHAQRYLVRRITSIATRLVPDGSGVELRFINNEGDGLSQLNQEQVDSVIEDIKPNGYTRIGAGLQEKILQPLIYDVLNRDEILKRPYLVSIITDGVPEPEERDTLRNTIAACTARLKREGYGTGAVMFQVSLVGTDVRADEFLDTLREDLEIKEVLHCTRGKLDAKYRELRYNEKHLEEWASHTALDAYHKR